MPDPSLRGDRAALAMAAPAEAGRLLGRLIPPGPVLELCCGVGGLTRGLAAEHEVLAVDRNRERLFMARENLAVVGLAGRVNWLCCDLRRQALANPPPISFSACVADPDWSPAGAPTREWTQDLQAMRPPARDLLAWARGMSPRLGLRLPPDWACSDLSMYLPCRRLEVARGGATRFLFLLLGDWPPGPERLELGG